MSLPAFKMFQPPCRGSTVLLPSFWFLPELRPELSSATASFCFNFSPFRCYHPPALKMCPQINQRVSSRSIFCCGFLFCAFIHTPGRKGFMGMQRSVRGKTRKGTPCGLALALRLCLCCPFVRPGTRSWLSTISHCTWDSQKLRIQLQAK